MSGPDDLAPALLDAMSGAGIGVAAVRDLRRLSGGASRETWSFVADLDDGTAADLVLQRTRRGSAAAMPMTLEAELLVAAGAAGVPVPAVRASGPAGGALGGAWVVVDRVAGETIARRVLRDDEFARARPLLVGQAAVALAAIHRMAPGAVPDLPAADPLDQLRTLVDALGEPHPALELGFRWLSANRPTSGPPAVVHGDFRLGNLVVGPEGLRAVLDWELAHLGDPVEDLGWLCVRAWRFGADPPVAGLGSREELLAAYEAETGLAVDPAALRWWEALGCLRWGAICMLQTHSHLSGAARSVELAAIGRRTCEAEYDLLLLLDPPAGGPTDDDVPVAGPTPPGPHDRPHLAELVEAVREFLERDVQEATEGRVRFHARVAGNVLAMVERELASGPGQAVAHATRLAALGAADDADLVVRLRSGALDDRLDEVGARVRAAVVDKVRVANPSYLEPGDR